MADDVVATTGRAPADAGVSPGNDAAPIPDAGVGAGIRFAARARVDWTVRDADTGASGPVLHAVVIQHSAKRVFIRATAPDGRMLFRWVSARDLREVERVES